MRSSLHFVGWMILDRDVSNKRDLYKYKLKRCSQIKEIKMVNIVKDYGVCFVIVERDVKEIDSSCFGRDKCFVFQTLAFLLQWPLLFIELEFLGKQANKELLSFQFKFKKKAPQRLGEKACIECFFNLPRTFSRFQPNLNEIVAHVLSSLW